ncbi:hypothetical protein DS901_18135 [Loktanella sp. D2R18]|uniref:DNA/RNA non-specific endonuclease n=1 Tax=Rhodobacterales TaxID=204455 RepID=UPI000DEB1657|nr:MULTISPECIES: DNA/RNA non-specific endonuclease [Rhodobacterales]MDO6590515.1 DNA/RNA non-specific endonuclease [Yoonia sp. 1_MG-2023]RBW41232.1 hypothetical protein DS901_18135 [Loktanella sp. D2R18]
MLKSFMTLHLGAEMPLGYSETFLENGLRVPIPKPKHPDLISQMLRREALDEGIYSHHTNFTLTMNGQHRQLIVAAHNIDQTAYKKAARSGSWSFDDAVGKDNQVPAVYYDEDIVSYGQSVPNDFDKGHMVPFANARHGPDVDAALLAAKETYVWSNCSPQHRNLNQSEWVYLERYIVRPLKLDSNGKLCVFTGPIWGALDRTIYVSSRNDPVRAPAGFFKVICFHMAEAVRGSHLGVLTFAIFQDKEALRTKAGGAVIKTDRKYQVTIAQLQEWTGLDFGPEIADANPMIYNPSTARRINPPVRTPEVVPIGNSSDVMTHLESTRSGQQILAQREISISSAMIRPRSPEKGHEWVSLLNRTEHEIDLTGWVLRSKSGRSATLNGSVAAGRVHVIEGKKMGTLRLGNQGGDLMLRNSNNLVVDHVTWTRKALLHVGPGISYEFELGR